MDTMAVGTIFPGVSWWGTKAGGDVFSGAFRVGATAGGAIISDAFRVGAAADAVDFEEELTRRPSKGNGARLSLEKRIYVGQDRTCRS